MTDGVDPGRLNVNFLSIDLLQVCLTGFVTDFSLFGLGRLTTVSISLWP